MLYGDSGQSRVVVPARQQHALLHTTLNLTLERFMIALKRPVAYSRVSC
ncbi:Uncharacterised protein [Klebsiella pneumoniae]|nr:Uncharacterised protein [Klebsiella pneumoniae]